MLEQIGLGVIGCGVIADLMYLPHTNRRVHGCQVDLVAVSDTVEEKAIRAKQRFGARQCYSDYRDLLADPEVDAVVIATNIASHGELALAAARAGKHILLQKPIAETLEEAEQVIVEAERAGVKLQVEPAHMLNPLCVRAQEAIRSGALGEICMIEGRTAHGGAEDRPWLFQRSGGGSVMLDLAVHALTWVVTLAGPARRVTAFTRTSVPTREINGEPLSVDIDDNVTLMLDFRDGALGTVVANYITIADLAPTFSVYGTEGTIHINSPQSPFLLFSRQASYLGQSGWLSPTDFRGHRAQLVSMPSSYDAARTPRHSSMGHFVECLVEDRAPAPGASIARHVLEIMTRAAEVERTGMTQTLQTTFEPLS